MNWTKEQQRIIDERDANILVSAAAGSGKTAVLVERIIEKVISKDDPKDIDEFLVVTFTKAAAAQMREKIASKLEKALDADPLNEHLMKQFVLVNRADITTIDSFCLKLVKEHFSMLDIDSSFGIGDPGMMDLMKNDVLEELFEERYREIDSRGNGKDFAYLVDVFCQDKDDDKLKEIILRINTMCESYSIPEKWIENAKAMLEINTEKDFEDCPWVKDIINITKSKLKDVIYSVERALDICGESGGPDKNIVITNADMDVVEKLLSCDTFRELQHAFANVKWERLKTCKGDEYDQDLVDEYKKIRESYKNMVKDFNFFNSSIEDILEEIKSIRRYFIPLLDLITEFRNRFAAIKKERKIYEFSDIEHFAFQLVSTGEYDVEGRAIPTAIGKEISERYSEIFIDEYQDSNYLQEDILCAVSKIYKGIYNMFMVGDVKQSIYRFRMARPDLFLAKYDKYQDSGNEIKIELKNNFRSRKEVLQTANYFFYQLMGKDLGGIEYNENVALVPTKEYPDWGEYGLQDVNTEILLCDYDAENQNSANNDLGADNSEGEDASYEDVDRVDKLSLEAHIIANRIKELVDPENGMMVFDEDKNIYRRANYGDIVILARAMKGFGQVVSNILRDSGIPVHVDDPKGYFDAVEIKTILSLLNVVDNSKQDIPLAAVLLSPMGKLTENDLAVICNYVGKDKKDINESSELKTLYGKCEYYMLSNENDEIVRKLERILGIINELKEDKTKMSIQSLLWKALDITGYYTYAKSMPVGRRRKANIDMLLEKAAAYEDGYYKGLFNFLRYIEKLKYNDIDFGEANVLDGDEEVVRIISMHKSKGLEYPIVFVSGLGKGFNKMDSRNSVILHSDYYLSGSMFDVNQRYKKNTFIRKSFNMMLEIDNMAEELRILYVALTRAKEKLILTGAESNLANKMKYIEANCGIRDRLLPYFVRSDSGDFMQLILGCMYRYDNNFKIVNKNEMPVIKYRRYTYKKALANIVSKAADEGSIVAEVRDEARNIVIDGDKYKEILEYQYKYDAYSKIKGKMSISEIKRMKAFDGNGFDVAEPEDVAYKKEATESKSGFSGADRGTIIHKFMELIDFRELYENADINDYIDKLKLRLVEDNIFDEKEISVINNRYIKTMLDSPLGKRMIKADTTDDLFKEQQFSMGIPVGEIYLEMNELSDKVDDVVIVQGIVDAFFVEDGEIVVMDYKTDNADSDTLIGRYKAQLDYYASTLEKLTGKRVKEKILYSFKNGCEIPLP